MGSDNIETDGGVLPIPPDFPVTWDSEDEAAMLWRWDDIHSPLPASPMSVSISEASMGSGSARGARELKRPSRGPRKRFNALAQPFQLRGEFFTFPLKPPSRYVLGRVSLHWVSPAPAPQLDGRRHNSRGSRRRPRAQYL